LTGVWVGNNDGSPMRDVQGAAGAGRIYKAFMLDALGNVEPRRFTRPADVVDREVCAATGQLPGPNCQRRVTDVFLRANMPTEVDDGVRPVEVCKVNGKLAFDAVPANAREMRMFFTVPPEAVAWANQNGRPSAPTARCDDIYKGIKRAEISGPAGPVSLQTSVPITGIATMDDFDHYDLELGAGAAPEQWMTLVTGRNQSTGETTLGSLNPLNLGQLRNGTYTLRLRVLDSLGNDVSGVRQISVLAPVASPTAQPIPAASPPPVTRTPAARPTSTPTPRRN
jgi:hypothetical protein